MGVYNAQQAAACLHEQCQRDYASSTPGPHAEHGCQMQGSLAYMEASLQLHVLSWSDVVLLWLHDLLFPGSCDAFLFCG